LIGAASDPYIAVQDPREKARRHYPYIEMLAWTGLSFSPKIMKQAPMPVIVNFQSKTLTGADVAF